MAAPSQLLEFLRDCHVADSGGRSDDVSGTPGVLGELDRLVAAESLSPPLESLIGLDPVPPRAGSARSESLPVTLSPEQQKAVRAASTQTLSLLLGPPGTGKSYTIAAIALDHVLRGESVLLCARSEQALRSVEKHLRSFADASLPLACGRDREGFRRSLAELLDGDRVLRDPEGSDLATEREELDVLDRKLVALEKEVEMRIALENSWGELAASSSSSVLERLLRPLRRLSVDRRLARSSPPASVVSEYQRLVERRASVAARLAANTLAHRLARALEDDPETLRKVVAMLAPVDTPGGRCVDPIDPRRLLEALPLWLVTLADLPRVLPLAKGMFSLTIIDEATQCDLASPLPALYRGRRAMVAGDARQLRHLSFLARDRQRELAERHDLDDRALAMLDYRSQSLLDLVTDQCVDPEQVVRLREHYRSHPDIISFSDRAFYGGSLRVMTRHPRNLREPGLELRRVAGRRLPEGHNPEEVEVVVEEVLRWVGNETFVTDGRCHSIGVLSPFRDQVDRFSSELKKALPRRAAERHRLVAGTPHDFQGDERDVMLISFTIDRDAPAGTLRYLDRPDVFNVAITRARDFQFVVCSVEPGDLPRESLLRRYLESIDEEEGVAASRADAAQVNKVQANRRLRDDAFTREVRDALLEKGLQTWTGWRVAGLLVDLVVEKDGSCLGIDLIGCPGPSSEAHSLDRYRMLARAGLELVPIPYSSWRRDRDACVGMLRERLDASQQEAAIVPM